MLLWACFVLNLTYKKWIILRTNDKIKTFLGILLFQVILTAAAVVGFTFRRILGMYLQPPSQPVPPGPISGGARVIPFSETISETTPSLFNDESENVAFPSAPPSYEDAIKSGSGNGELELPPPYAPSAPPPPDPRSTSVWFWSNQIKSDDCVRNIETWQVSGKNDLIIVFNIRSFAEIKSFHTQWNQVNARPKINNSPDNFFEKSDKNCKTLWIEERVSLRESRIRHKQKFSSCSVKKIYFD